MVKGNRAIAEEETKWEIVSAPVVPRNDEGQ